MPIFCNDRYPATWHGCLNVNCLVVEYEYMLFIFRLCSTSSQFCISKVALRIPAIHGAKTTKNRPPWYVLLDYFTTRPSFKNLYDPFLTKWPRDAKMCKHLKSTLWWQSWNLKHRKFLNLWRFQFQLCHQRALFKCLHIFSISGHLVKKGSHRFLQDSLAAKYHAKHTRGVDF